jgi:hypothetical protein
MARSPVATAMAAEGLATYATETASGSANRGFGVTPCDRRGFTGEAERAILLGALAGGRGG